MASGPSHSARAVELARSQKSTVTCLRSPVSAAREVRILSARWRGVYASGARSGVGMGTADGALSPTHTSTAPSSSMASFLAWMISAFRSSRYSSSRSKRLRSARYDTRPSRWRTSITRARVSSKVIGGPPKAREFLEVCDGRLHPIDGELLQPIQVWYHGMHDSLWQLFFGRTRLR